MSELEYGKTYHPRNHALEISENIVRGSWWKVEREEIGIVLEFLAARHGGGVERFSIDENEFISLKNDLLSVDDLIKKYDKNNI